MMKQKVIKIRVESDDEEDLKDVLKVATDSIKDQPWRSENTRVVRSWITDKN